MIGTLVGGSGIGARAAVTEVRPASVGEFGRGNGQECKRVGRALQWRKTSDFYQGQSSRLDEVADIEDERL